MSGGDVDQALAAGGEVVEVKPPLQRLQGVCPISALGHSDEVFYFLNATGQVVHRTPREFSANSVLGLFLGETQWLELNFAIDRNRRDGKPGWDNVAASAQLMQACRAAGFFHPSRAVRGPGVWLENDTPAGDGHAAALVVHMGDHLKCVRYDDGVTIKVETAGQRIGEWVYHAEAPEPSIADGAAVGTDAATTLLGLLETCSFGRPETDPRLLLGWTGLGMCVGAAPYRPPLWLVAPSTAGKSSVIRLLRGLMGSAALYYKDPTMTGVRRDLAGAARAVILDEFELKENNRRAQDLVEMARNTYERGGDGYTRGGSDAGHGSSEAVFLFSSVEPPAVEAQDANRRVVLELKKIKRAPEDAVAFEAALSKAATLGPTLRRRVIDQWGRFDATFAMYRRTLMLAGHDARGADTYGVLLAMADLLDSDGPVIEDVAGAWAEKLSAATIQVQDDIVPTEVEAWNFLMHSVVEKWQGGDRALVGTLLGEVVHGDDIDARKTLSRRGIAVRIYDGIKYVVVANKHPGLDEIFRNTRWKGGGWSTLFRRLDGAGKTANAVKFAGEPLRATRVPAERVQLPDADEDEALDSAAQAALAARGGPSDEDIPF